MSMIKKVTKKIDKAIPGYKDRKAEREEKKYKKQCEELGIHYYTPEERAANTIACGVIGVGALAILGICAVADAIDNGD